MAEAAKVGGPQKPWRQRCKFHGGMSTAARTREGIERIRASLGPPMGLVYQAAARLVPAVKSCCRRFGAMLRA